MIDLLGLIQYVFGYLSFRRTNDTFENDSIFLRVKTITELNSPVGYIVPNPLIETAVR